MAAGTNWSDRIELAVSLAQAQIECARRVHGWLPQWRLSEAALARLAKRVPGFGDGRHAWGEEAGSNADSLTDHSELFLFGVGVSLGDDLLQNLPTFLDITRPKPDSVTPPTFVIIHQVQFGCFQTILHLR